MKRSRNSALAVRTSTDIDHCCRQVLRTLNGTLSSGVSLKKKPLLAHSRSKRPLPISDQGEAHDRTASSFQTNDHVRPCNLKPQRRDLTPVLRRPVEPAPRQRTSTIV